MKIDHMRRRGFNKKKGKEVRGAKGKTTMELNMVRKGHTGD